LGGAGAREAFPMAPVHLQGKLVALLSCPEYLTIREMMTRGQMEQKQARRSVSTSGRLVW